MIIGNTFAPSPFIRLAPININSTTFAPSLIKLKGGAKNPRCKIKIKYHTSSRALPLSFEQDASPSRKNVSFPRLRKSSSGGNLSRLVSLFYPDNSWEIYSIPCFKAFDVTGSYVETGRDGIYPPRPFPSRFEENIFTTINYLVLRI